jgi:hypothetical protein
LKIVGKCLNILSIVQTSELVHLKSGGLRCYFQEGL